MGMTLSEQLQAVQATIRERAGDRPITVVAVTKYATVAQMRAAYQAGLRHFGENKVQDALGKMEAFPPEEFPDLRWHLIGSLQSNKVKKTVGAFSLIHSVDSETLAEHLSKQNVLAQNCQPVLLQLNLSDDGSRHGFAPQTVLPALSRIAALPGITVRGLMAMAPPEASLAQNESILKRHFDSVLQLRETLTAELGIPLPEISMGMSHDFPQALSSGATIIRIGNYLFKT